MNHADIDIRMCRHRFDLIKRKIFDLTEMRILSVGLDAGLLDLDNPPSKDILLDKFLTMGVTVKRSKFNFYEYENLLADIAQLDPDQHKWVDNTKIWHSLKVGVHILRAYYLDRCETEKKIMP